MKKAITTITNWLVCQKSSPISPLLFYLPKNVLSVFSVPGWHSQFKKAGLGSPSGTEALSNIARRAGWTTESLLCHPPQGFKPFCPLDPFLIRKLRILLTPEAMKIHPVAVMARQKWGLSKAKKKVILYKKITVHNWSSVTLNFSVNSNSGTLNNSFQWLHAESFSYPL